MVCLICGHANSLDAEECEKCQTPVSEVQKRCPNPKCRTVLA